MNERRQGNLDVSPFFSLSFSSRPSHLQGVRTRALWFLGLPFSCFFSVTETLLILSWVNLLCLPLHSTVPRRFVWNEENGLRGFAIGTPVSSRTSHPCVLCLTLVSLWDWPGPKMLQCSPTVPLSLLPLHIRGSREGAWLFPHLRVVWSNLLSKSTNVCKL